MLLKSIKQIKCLILFLCSLLCVNSESTECTLPYSWSGIWSNQQQKDLNNNLNQELNNVFNSATISSNHNLNFNSIFKTIDDINFLNKGRCINNKDERYFFYDKCLFIIQRHFNVLQYRETHCDEEMTKFEELCELLSPDLPLLTMIREDAIAEKCPLSDSYKIFNSKNHRSLINSIQSDMNKFNTYEHSDIRSHNSNKCFKKPESNIISKCHDNTMLRMDFQDCFDIQSSSNSNENKNKKLDQINKNKEPLAQRLTSNRSDLIFNELENEENGLVAQCIAHWTEGSLNYLIVKQRDKINRNNLQTFKCLLYKDLDRPFKNVNNNNNLLNPTNNLIQLSLSEDEFCRDFYVTSDGMNSFTLEKNKEKINLKLHNNHKAKYHLNNHHKNNDKNNKCKFPKVLNKKWKNLHQTKLAFTINQNLIHVIDSNYRKKSINQTQSSNLNQHNFNKHKSKKYLNRNNQNSYDSSYTSVYLKLNCIESMNKHFVNDNEVDDLDNDYKKYEYLYLVNNLLECSSKQKCLSIKFKSDFILSIKYGNYDNKNQKCLFDTKNLIYQDILFIETDYGVDCPFSNRIYQLSNDKLEKNEINRLKRNFNNKRTQFSSIYGNEFPININNQYYDDTDCKHYLKIGCNSNDYSIYKKCEYSYNKQNIITKNQNRKIKKESSFYSTFSFPSFKYNSNSNDNLNQQLPILESETNRICLAFWKLDKDSLRQLDDSNNIDENEYDYLNDQDENYIVLSKQANAENYTVTCSIWESSNNILKISDDESLNLCLNMRYSKEFIKNKKFNLKNRFDSSFDYKIQNQNEYSISSASASAIISSNSKYDDDISLSFDYTGSCSLNNATINFSHKNNIFFCFLFLAYFFK